MKTTELRIGNLVQDKGGFIFYIDAIFRDTLYLNFEGNEGDIWEVNEKDVEPIPLTDEKLLKFGYKKYYNGYRLTDINSLSFSITKYGEYLPCWKDRTLGIETIKYVHQLQNLFFALTGEELLIKKTPRNEKTLLPIK